MKSNPFKWLILLCLPFIIGANQCQLTQNFKQAVEEKITTNKSQDIQITVVPIADMVRTPDSQRVIWHISPFLANGMKKVAEIFNHSEVRFVFYDKRGIKKSEYAPQLHLYGKNINVHSLAQLIEKSANNKTALLNSVIKDYMDPLNTDILLAGQYKLANNKKLLDIFIFFKPNKTFSKKTIALTGQKLICQDSKKSEDELCDDAAEKIGLTILSMFMGDDAKTSPPKKTCGSADPDDITNMLPGNCVEKSTALDCKVVFNPKKLQDIIDGKSTNAKAPSSSSTQPSSAQQSIPQPSRKKPQSSSGQTTYITQLSFVDTSSYTSIKPNENKWINTAVQRGIQATVKKKSTLKFNSKAHTIQNTDSNFLKFIDTFYDPNKGIKDALQAVIQDIMVPNGVDIIVTGEYERKGKVVHVKPILLLKNKQSQLAKKLQFKKSDFECIEEDFWDGKSTKVLCSKARREIEKAVADLLGHL